MQTQSKSFWFTRLLTRPVVSADGDARSGRDRQEESHMRRFPRRTASFTGVTRRMSAICV